MIFLSWLKPIEVLLLRVCRKSHNYTKTNLQKAIKVFDRDCLELIPTWLTKANFICFYSCFYYIQGQFCTLNMKAEIRYGSKDLAKDLDVKVCVLESLAWLLFGLLVSSIVFTRVIWTQIYRYLRVHFGSIKCLQGFSGALRFLRYLSGSFGFIWVHLGSFRLLQLPSGAFRFHQVT